MTDPADGTQPAPATPPPPPVALPDGTPDERELLLSWLGFLRGAVLRKLDGLDEAQARWTPDGRLLPLLGIVNHLSHVEARWIDGAMRGGPFSRDEAEFRPGPELTVAAATAAYRARADATATFVRGNASLSTPCTWGTNRDLRWVLLHLINETARHAGHADARGSPANSVRAKHRTARVRTLVPWSAGARVQEKRGGPRRSIDRRLDPGRASPRRRIRRAETDLTRSATNLYTRLTHGAAAARAPHTQCAGRCAAATG